MKILLIIFFTIVIFLCAYLPNREKKKKHKWIAVCIGLGAAISFVATFIVNSVEHKHEKSYEKKENVINATCHDAGRYELVSYCECGEELGREIFTVESLGHDFVEEICTRCGTVSSEYEPLIISRANELVDIGKYDEAFNIVSEALDRVSSDSLQQLLSNIQGMEEKDSKYIAKNVEFITYSGSINSSDQTDTYSLDVPVTGYYRFDVNNMVSGFSVELQIDDSVGNKIGGSSAISNGRGVTCELVQGNNYTVKVISYSNTGSYTLTIGQQKALVDISAKEIIYDSIEFKDQQNQYTFIPSIDGIYRFDFKNIINDFSLKMEVYDSLGNKIVGSFGIDNGAGVTVELVANEIYTIKVIQYSNTGVYTLVIGKQHSIQDIHGRDSFSGDIIYKDQKRIYILNPPSTGEYILELYNMPKEFSVKLYVYDSLGYKVGGGFALSNGSKVEVDLNAGEIYTINLIQYSNIGSYSVSISRKGE